MKGEEKYKRPSPEHTSTPPTPAVGTKEILTAGNYPVNLKQIFFVFTVSASAILCGTMNGWTTVLPKLQNDTTNFTVSVEEVSWLVSMTPLIMMFVSMSAGYLMELMGPRHLMQLSIILNALSSLLMAFTPYKWLLYLGRALGSVAYSFINTLSQPLVAEMSSTKIRGLASTGPEVLGASGLLLGMVLAAYFDWDVATALLAVPALMLMIPSVFVPESPYWFVRRGRFEDARNSLRKLAGNKADIDKELVALTNVPSATQTSFKKQYEELKKGRNFRPLLLLLSIFILRELGGRAAIFQYAVYIFLKAGINLDPFTCAITLGFVRLLCVCVSALILDRVGRRPLLLGSALLGGLAQFLVGLLLYLEFKTASWLLLVAMMVYVGCYGIGVGPIPWVFVGELLPSPIRTLGSSIVIFTGTLTIFSLNIAFLWLISSLGLGETLLGFSFCNFLIFCIVWRWIPETGGASLQELEQAFSSRGKNGGKLTQVIICDEKMEKREKIVEKSDSPEKNTEKISLENSCDKEKEILMAQNSEKSENHEESLKT